MGGSLRRRARSVVTLAVGLVSVVALLAYAVLADGYPVRKVDLNDAGVWVTSNQDATFGRFNKSAAFLDAFFNPPGGSQTSYDLDVLQDQGSVVARDVAGGRAYPVDVATGKTMTDAGADILPGAVMRMAGGTLAVLDPASGKLWAMRYEPGARVPALSSLSSTAPAVAEVGAAPKGDKEATSFSALAVGVDGSVHVVTRAGKLVTVPASAGRLAKPVTSTVADRLGVVDVSAVGPTPVVLDEASGKVLVAGTTADVPTDGKPARLQMPVAASEGTISVASTQGLFRVDAAAGKVTDVFTGGSTGAPAAPVEASGCLWGAWAGSPGTVVKSCGGGPATQVGVDRGGALVRPVFRVNRGVALLNDVSDGRVFDLDLKKSLDEWQDVRPPDQRSSDEKPTKQQVEDTKNKPKANPDDLGARPGRTTILHVLDNDTDPSGKVLSVAAVTDPGNPNATVEISPDGQSIRYTLSAGGGDSQFEYDLSNGVNTARGKVSVRAIAPDENHEPFRRPGEPPRLTVASGGTLPVPVIDDWRDKDGDPVTIVDVAANSGSAISTPDGRIEFTAPGSGEGGTVEVGYTVSDGRGKPQQGKVSVTVQRGDATQAVPPQTEPDVARGEAARPIDIAPLANDTQGSDPLNPRATLALAAPVAARAGIEVETDVATGRIVATPTKPGTYFLTYSAAYGSAPITKGEIRVDALKPGSAPTDPVAMPDDAAIHGQSPVLVDVLANDVDPAGGMLTVTAATAEDSTQLQVAVLKGRWLRIMPTTATFEPNPQLVHYTVTNGASSSSGDVLVTQLPVIDNDPPVTRPDYATVRDGDSVLVPVLDNDATRGGQPLSLLADTGVDGTAVGTLHVIDPAAKEGQAPGDLGTAYVSGDRIRYVAAAAVDQTMTLHVEYVAQAENGERANGVLELTVNPQPRQGFENRAPSARPLDERAVAGETVTIDVDPSGNDPDGDSTAVAGIASSPTLGRVLGITPTGIRYQAYPTSSGLDSFSYSITDRYGKVSTSLVRIAVIPPGLPQPAVPVVDEVTAAPGSTVTVAPLANDFYSATDPVRIRPLEQTNPELPDGVHLDTMTNTIRVPAPDAKAKPTEVAYGISGNGGDSSTSRVVVTGVEGFRNPPRVFDVVAKPDKGAAGTATADVLATAYDPDGDSRALEVSVAASAKATVVGGKVTVPMSDRTQALPVQVTDESGAVSAAVLYVPPSGAPGPYLRDGSLIRVDPGVPAPQQLSAYVADGQGKPVALTTTDHLWASPEGKVAVTATGKDTFTVTAAKDYVGPAAVTLEVTDGASLDDPKGITTLVTIPVQVGPDTPVIRCPEAPIRLVAGGKPLVVDPMSLCSVWAPTEEMARSLTFRADWGTTASGVSIEGSGRRRFTLTASGAAKPGAKGTLKVAAVGTQAAPSTLAVVVVAAPPPTLARIDLPEMKQGDARRVDLRSYLTSPLADAQPTVVSITQLNGQKAVSSEDGSTVTITPGASSHGTMSFRVVASDVADPRRTDRQVSGTITFQVFGRPDTPARPQPGSSTLSHSAVLSWPAPAANGAPIDGYEVKWGGGTTKCSASPCTIKGLANGTAYTFQVRAHNKAEWSDWSAPSASYKPNEAPKAVPNFHQTRADDHSVTLTWGAAAVDGSPVTDYIVAVNGKQQSFGRALTGTVTGLDNGPTYTFTIIAKNEYRAGPSSTTKGNAAGSPKFAGPVTFGPVAAADADTTAVNVQWPSGDPNGPSPIQYTVTRTTDGKAVCANVEATSCIDQGVAFGKTYAYSVIGRTTFLGTTRESATQSATITPVGVPAAWQAIAASPTGANNAVKLTYSVPPSRGTSATVSVLVNGGVNATFSAPPAGVTGQTRTISVPSNGVDYSIAMRVCNESNNCSTSNTVSANAYGPIPTPSISLSKDGPTTFQVHVTANGNGRQVNLRVWTDSGRTWNVSTVASKTWNLGQYGVSYSQSDRAHVTVTDTAGRPVPGQVDSNAQTADPPPPSVAVSKGAYGTYSGAGGTCTSCWKVHLVLKNFTSAETCSYQLNGAAAWWSEPGVPQNFVGDRNVWNGYSGTVTVTCTDGQGHRASGSAPW